MQQSDEALLSAFTALEDLRALSQESSAGAARPAVSRIAAYARRGGRVADLALERILRSDPRARALYSEALKGSARSYVPQAAAASGAELRERIVGGHRIELITEDARDYLVVHLHADGAEVRQVEARSPDGEGGRVDLGEPIDGVLQAWLDPDNPEMLAVRRAIASPLAAIYLL
jgi:hypothetical protein